MKKIFSTILITLFLFSNVFAGGGKNLVEIEYGFILGEVADVREIIVDKDPYYSLDAGKDKRIYYSIKLKNTKYITHNGVQTNLLSKGVHVSISQFGLKSLFGEYEDDYEYIPQIGDKIITIYKEKDEEIEFDEFYTEEVYQFYVRSGILNEDYINIGISGMIQCNNGDINIEGHVQESIGIPYENYKSDEEKILIQKQILIKIISDSEICINNGKNDPVAQKAYGKMYYLIFLLALLGIMFTLVKKKKVIK